MSSTKPWTRWNWDFLPLYSAEFWFTPEDSGRDATLQLGDWFMMARVSADDAYVSDGEKSRGFSGPDPALMVPVEESSSRIDIHIYQVTGKASKGKSAREVISADADPDWEDRVWEDMPGVGARRITFTGGLEDYLAEGSFTGLISDIRDELTSAGVIARQ